MGEEIKEDITGLRVQDDSIYFTLHGKPFVLYVEPHMRHHIKHETQGFAGFNVESSSPFARIEMLSYTPELGEMDKNELITLITLFREDIEEDDS
jgi:hypothetical protein